VKKTIWILVILVLAGLVGRQIYLKASSSEPEQAGRGKARPVAVELAPVRSQTIRDVGMFTGTLHPHSQFRVAPKIGGRLERLLVNVGDKVQREQLVAVLDPGEYAQQVDQARAELDVARAQLEAGLSALNIAQRELERVRELRKKKIASESELDAAEAEFKSQSAKQRVFQAQVAQKRAALEASQVRLSYTRISVPGNRGNGTRWVVGERHVDEGALMAPNEPMVSVLDIGTLIAVIHVIEKDYPKVSVGQAASITAEAFPGKVFFGRIVRVAPLLKETSRQARVEIEIPNTDTLLKPGMFVRAEIEFDRRENAVVIPVNALVSRGAEQGVFLADPEERKARFVPVTPGIVNGVDAEVLAPPLSGSVVIVGQHLLQDGSEILLPGPAPSAPGREGSSDPSGSSEGTTGAVQGASS